MTSLIGEIETAVSPLAAAIDAAAGCLVGMWRDMSKRADLSVIQGWKDKGRRKVADIVPMIAEHDGLPTADARMRAEDLVLCRATEVFYLERAAELMTA